MNHILIPTDFSQNAMDALNYAIQLYLDQPCTFYILNVYKMDFDNRSALNAGVGDHYEIDSHRGFSEKGLKQTMEKISAMETGKNHHFEPISILEDLFPAMKSIVREKHIDMVVMGTKGASNYENKVFGSNAINTMEHLNDCPILSVPMDTKVKGIKEVVLPTDYKLKYDSTHIQRLMEIIKLQEAHLCVVHVSEEKELTHEEQQHKNLIEAQLTSVSHSFHHLTGHDVNEGVKHFIESRDSSMLAFGNRKHNFLTKLFSTNMVMEFGMFSEIPLFVMSGK